MKDKIKLWYSLGLWSAQMVRQAAEILGEGAEA